MALQTSQEWWAGQVADQLATDVVCTGPVSCEASNMWSARNVGRRDQAVGVLSHTIRPNTVGSLVLAVIEGREIVRLIPTKRVHGVQAR